MTTTPIDVYIERSNISHLRVRTFPIPAFFVPLKVHGTSAGGDADELRLLSTSETFIRLHAHGGSLDFLSTKVR